MKVVILAGGYGTRLSEYTSAMPKPMVPVAGKPLIWHVMKTYSHFGFKDFVIALGYKSSHIKEYFLNYRNLNSDFSINLNSGDITHLELDLVDWNVTLCDTGEHTMTGGRVKRLANVVGAAPFLLTYGDGVANVDINRLLEFHQKGQKLITVTAVRPPARFGELELEGDRVRSFREKPQLQQGWINGGFFIVEPGFLKLIDGDKTMLEREPLELATKMGELMAYKHHGFWHCVDTKRDLDALNELAAIGVPPWSIFSD